MSDTKNQFLDENPDSNIEDANVSETTRTEALQGDPYLDGTVSTDETIAGSSEVNSLFAIQGLISSHLGKIQAIQDEMARLTEMFNSILENSETYNEVAEKAKEAALAKNNAKKEVLKHPQAMELANQIKELKAQMKDFKSALSDYLVQYRLLSGQDTLEDENGEVRQIISSAKLVKRA